MVKTDSEYFVVVTSDSMYDPADRDSIRVGDHLQIDPKLTPEDGDFVIVELGKFVGVRKLIIRDGKHLLTCANPAWPGLVEVRGDVRVIGVVIMTGRDRGRARDAEKAGMGVVKVEPFEDVIRWRVEDSDGVYLGTFANHDEAHAFMKGLDSHAEYISLIRVAPDKEVNHV